MKKMLNKEELSRISLKTLFNHPWIKDTINVDFVPFNKIYKLNDDNNDDEINDSPDEQVNRKKSSFSESEDSFNESIDDNDNGDDDMIIGNFEKFELESNSPKPSPKLGHKYNRSISFRN
jgi:hypothetical protein